MEDILSGKTIDRQPAQTSLSFKKAPEAKGKTQKNAALTFNAPEE